MTTDPSAVAAASAVLSSHGLGMLLFAFVVFALFIWDRLPITTVCLGILVTLPVLFVLAPLNTADGQVDPMRFFAGFGHPALMAICGLMVLGHGLVVTGALEPAARVLAGWVGKQPKLALLAVMVGAASVSGVINDTPVVVLLIPLILAAAKRARVSASVMLLPMNYAVLIGGMATTIGTSTNLIVVSLAIGMGVAPFGLFSFAPIVALAAIPALAYLWVVAPLMLTQVHPPAEKFSEQVFDAELRVEAGGWLEGKHLRDAFSATGNRLQLRELRRNGKAMARLPSMTLRANDLLLIQATASDLKDFEATLHVALHGVDTEATQTERPNKSAGAEEEADSKASMAPVSAVVAQLIITPESPLVGRTIRQERFADHYSTIVVGLRPRQQLDGWQREGLASRVIGTGDILLLQGKSEDIKQVQRKGHGLLLDAQYALPRQDKANIAMAVMAVVVVLAATKTLPIALAALGGVIALLAARCLSWEDVTQSLSVKVIMLVAASLALGDALEITGATRWGAQQLAGVAGSLSPAWVLALLMGLMGLITNFVSNNAAAAIGTPLGIELARSLGVPPEPFVLAVLFGCNLCYLTPMGYQTNLLVMNAGGYRFNDFVRVGTPLFFIMWAGLCYGLVVRYGL